MGERTFVSIGQVLDLLKVEFPDLTISKIRFLESQGLLDPERTPSGYRKFYETDVDRLRFILREQQEHYLPLKVIKGRLGGDAEGADSMAVFADHPGMRPMEPDVSGSGRVASGATVSKPSPRSGASGSSGPSGPSGSSGSSGPSGSRAAGPAPPLPRLELVDVEDGLDPPDPISLTVEELASAAGLELGDIAELEKFGLVAGRRVVGTTYYDAEALEVTCVAAAFRSFGVEARHLRMYRTAVEREAGFFEQVVTPMLKQRNPQSRRQAVETLLELSRLGNAMRAAMLREALRDHIGGG